MKRCYFRRTAFLISGFCLVTFAAAFAAENEAPGEIPAYIAGGVSFSVPSNWPSVTPDSRMRLYQFEVPSPDPMVGPAELSVF